MLYVSTRNKNDTFTAYRALHETNAPDGGFYVPFRLPVFTQDEISALRSQSCGDTIAQILNSFFGLRLTGWDVECKIGRYPFRTTIVNYRLIMAETWHNPGGSWDYLVRNLFQLIIGTEDHSSLPSGWPYIAVEIALFFGLFVSMEPAPCQKMDAAVTSGDFADVVALSYAKDMGLPINITVITSNENGAVWDFVKKGDFNTNASIVKTNLPHLDIPHPKYLEYFIFKTLGAREVQRYLESCQKKGIYHIDEDMVALLGKTVFTAVVSSNRVDSIISSMYRTNQYSMDPYTALAYGGLQDYRSRTGISNETLVLVKCKASREKE